MLCYKIGSMDDEVLVFTLGTGYGIYLHQVEKSVPEEDQINSFQ